MNTTELLTKQRIGWKDDTTMAPSKQAKQLAHFYKQVTILIKRSKEQYVSLTQLEDKFRHSKSRVFSWMQWEDAKHWFVCGTCDTGICYYLQRQYYDIPTTNIWHEIEQYYDH